MGDTRILVVDDEPRMRKLVKDFLNKEGYIPLEAGDGEEAYEQFLKTRDISLIIMDVMMPKMDGYEAAEEIRKMSKV
ncbi:MAG: response regulator, partial [Eubacterium sp.]|nr:response regulator [Eubacterium sp.]